MSAFQQLDKVRDYVFPLCRVANPNEEDWRFEQFLGTGFLIGSRGFALTAAHVLTPSASNRMAALFVAADCRWRGFRIALHEVHPTEDVCVLRLAGGSWRSFFRMSNTWEGSSARYKMFGYPEDVALELQAEGRVLTRPDLVYAEGYVRRRLSGHSLLGIRGTRFLELSEVVGPGCSGAPLFIIRPPFWDVIGIYVGERRSDESPNVAYAVREDAFRDWVPSCMGCSVLQEASSLAQGDL